MWNHKRRCSAGERPPSRSPVDVPANHGGRDGVRGEQTAGVPVRQEEAEERHDEADEFAERDEEEHEHGVHRGGGERRGQSDGGGERAERSEGGDDLDGGISDVADVDAVSGAARVVVVVVVCGEADESEQLEPVGEMRRHDAAVRE